MPLTPMGRVRRYQMHQLCGFYRLNSQSYGTGTKRYPAVNKSRHTCLPSEEEAENFIAAVMGDDVQEARSGKLNERVRYSDVRQHGIRDRKGTKKKRDHGGAFKSSTSSSSPAQTGRLVAHDADPIGEENKGYHLLMKMGWSGGGLGSQKQGIEAPIDALIKVNKRGLGFD